jgi:radical SAM superfamily enzyme YgiQ (UPF0313 family)
MASTEILLSTLNSSYSHAAFGLRYLYANLQELQSKARIEEFTINQKPRDMVEKILSFNPKIVGFGVYIWNTQETREVISILKRVRPELVIVLGGPEVSFETEEQAITKLADHVVIGEADFLFRDLAREILLGTTNLPKIIRGDLPEIKSIALPFEYFSDHDLQNRVLYVEASRGCPYKCEYCLSSLDKSVRNFPLDLFLAEMSKLIDRGARRFKFVDRTFNLSIAQSSRILEFFLARIELGLFLHFELVPDRLPPELLGIIERFPQGALQFEIGVQTWNPEVSRLVSRRQDYKKIAENFFLLRTKTKVHTHADLIAGLPGETLESFARGFDALAELAPDEIQVGILKRLRGTPIIRHDQEWKMIYSEDPPYTVLSTKNMDFPTIQKIHRFAKFWDLYANSGNFRGFLDFLIARKMGSLFSAFLEFSEFLSLRHPEAHSIALMNQLESAWLFATEKWPLERETLREILIHDYTAEKSRDVPRFLRTTDDNRQPNKAQKSLYATPERQRRRLEIRAT